MTDFRATAHAAADLAADHLDGIAGRPVFQPMSPEQRRHLLDLPLLAGPVPDAELLDFVRTHVLTHPMGNGHPRFFGWVNSPPNPAGTVAALLAAASNPSCAGGDHAGVYLEHTVVRWLGELAGFPAGGGLLVSGTSAASIHALAAARHRAAERAGWNPRAEGLQGNRPPLTLYLSAEGHSCLTKAAELLGLGTDNVRPVPVDAAHRLDVDALRAAIAADRAAGRLPFAVAASAGTVNTGQIDPLDAIAEVAAEHGLWFHVDGAYGAFGILDPALAGRYAGIGRADSLALDPHKWPGVPVDCGALLVRRPDDLRDTFSLVPAYLRTEPDAGFGGLPWFSEYGSEQTRPLRALKVWATFASLGRDGLAAMVTGHNALARSLAAAVTADPDLELTSEPVTSIVTFRHRVADNRRLATDIQAAGRVFVTATTVAGTDALRACILHPATTEADLDVLLAEVRRLAPAARPRP